MRSTVFQISSRTNATWDSLCNFLHTFIASDNSLRYLFSLTARRKLNELFAQLDNVTTACQLHNVLHDSFIRLNDLNSEVT